MPHFPRVIRVGIGVMLDFGTVASNTLLRLHITARHPSGDEPVLATVDVAAPGPEHLVTRASTSTIIEMNVDVPGVYEIGLRSGGTRLAHYPVEIKIHGT